MECSVIFAHTCTLIAKVLDTSNHFNANAGADIFAQSVSQHERLRRKSSTGCYGNEYERAVMDVWLCI
jgi:hypothetical protein